MSAGASALSGFTMARGAVEQTAPVPTCAVRLVVSVAMIDNGPTDVTREVAQAVCAYAPTWGLDAERRVTSEPSRARSAGQSPDAGAGAGTCASR